MLKRMLVLCALGLGLAIGLGMAYPSLGIDPRLEKKIFSLSHTNPASDAAVSLHRGDRRFISVYGFTTMVPNIAGGTTNSLVGLHDVKPIAGTSDSPVSWQAERFQEAAIAYATQYNAALLQNLLSKPDPKTRRLLVEIRAELQLLERSNPQQAALRAVKSGHPRFIYVAGEENDGSPDSTDKLLHEIGTRFLKSNALVLSGPDLQRFQNVMKNFVIPYNQSLYALLKQRASRSHPPHVPQKGVSSR